MFTLYNKNYLCTVDYHSKFPIIMKKENQSADSLIMICKIFFSEYRLPTKIMSDVGGSFISDKLKTFCTNLNIEVAVLSSCHHQCKGQVEACIQFSKWTLKKCFDTQSNPYIALLLIRSTPPGPGLSSPVTLLFNHPHRYYDNSY